MKKQGYVNQTFQSNEVFYDPIYEKKTPSRQSEPAKRDMPANNAGARTPTGRSRNSAPRYDVDLDPVASRKADDMSRKSKSTRGSGRNPRANGNNGPKSRPPYAVEHDGAQNGHVGDDKLSRATSKRSMDSNLTSQTTDSLYCINCINTYMANNRKRQMESQREYEVRMQREFNYYQTKTQEEQEMQNVAMKRKLIADRVQESAVRNKRVTESKRRQDEEDEAYRRRVEENAAYGCDFDHMAKDQKRAYAEELKRQIDEKNARRERGTEQVADYTEEMQQMECAMRQQKDEYYKALKGQIDDKEQREKSANQDARDKQRQTRDNWNKQQEEHSLGERELAKRKLQENQRLMEEMKVRESNKKDIEKSKLEEDRLQRLAYENQYGAECDHMERAKKEGNRKFAGELLHQIEDKNRNNARQVDFDRQGVQGQDYEGYACQMAEMEKSNKRDYAAALKQQINDNEARKVKGDVTPQGSDHGDWYADQAKLQQESYYNGLKSQIDAKQNIHDQAENVAKQNDRNLRESFTRQQEQHALQERDIALGKLNENKRLMSEMQIREAKKADAEKARLEGERRQRLDYEQYYAHECDEMDKAKRHRNHQFANDLLHQIDDKNKQNARQEAQEKQAVNANMDFGEYTKQMDDMERNQKKEYAEALRRQIEARRAKGEDIPDGGLEFGNYDQMYFEYDNAMKNSKDEYYKALKGQIDNREQRKKNANQQEDEENRKLRENWERTHVEAEEDARLRGEQKHNEVKRLNKDMEKRENAKEDALRRRKQQEVADRRVLEADYNKECTTMDDMMKTRNKMYTKDLQNQIEQKQNNRERQLNVERDNDARNRQLSAENDAYFRDQADIEN